VLITLRLKDPPHLGQLRGQPSGNALGLQPSGYHGSKIGPKGFYLTKHLVALSDGLVTLLEGRAVL